MSILDNLILKVGFLKSLVKTDDEAKQVEEKRVKVREELDRRLADIMTATMNGEQKWFLRLMREKPECAINVIKECDLDEIP